MEELRPVSDITGYHAHIHYVPASTRGDAERLREGIAIEFPTAVIGRWHDVPVGPHSEPMFQVAFEVGDFARMVPWLALNHRSCSVLIHPHTGNGKLDHLLHALWLGPQFAIYPARLSGELPEIKGWQPFTAELPAT
jgi:DOPA 4,5-dioxygenase